MSKITIGPVSEGTLKTDELLKKFAETMNEVVEGDIEERESVAHTCGRAEELSYILSLEGTDEIVQIQEEAEALLDYITGVLDEISPEGIRFGTADGDVACFGFFVDWDYLEEEIRDGRIIKNPDDRNAHRDKLVLDVNDHGNATLLMWSEPRQDWVEIWSVV